MVVSQAEVSKLVVSQKRVLNLFDLEEAQQNSRLLTFVLLLSLFVEHCATAQIRFCSPYVANNVRKKTAMLLMCVFWSIASVLL